MNKLFLFLFLVSYNKYKLTYNQTKFYLTTAHFTGTGYQGIKITGIHKVNGSSSYLKFTVDWKNKCSLFIDKYSIYDQYYYNLFLADQTTINNTKIALQDTLQQIPGFTSQDPNFGHLYIYEPASMYYLSIEQVSIYSKFISENKYYINGVLGNVSDWDSHLDNFQRHQIPYVISDIYPFKDEFDTTTTRTQNALDYLIEKSESGAAGTSKKGLRTMINYANNFTPNDPSDDRPFIQSLQVMNENLYSGNVQQPWYRAPTYNEILAKGWLSLCYGAKGFMYYCTWSGGTDELRTWGLLEPQRYPPNH